MIHITLFNSKSPTLLHTGKRAPDCLSQSASVFMEQNWIGYDSGHTDPPNMCSLQTTGAGIAQSL